VTPFSATLGHLTATRTSIYPATISLTGITDPLPAGAHTFTLKCNEVEADVFLQPSTILAVLLGDG
jgi:hypothetical protein